jgi:hypothetical protein
MDPNACWQNILEAFANGDREAAIEGLRDLADWLGGGGFMPDPAWAAHGDVGGFMSAVIHDIDVAVATISHLVKKP